MNTIVARHRRAGLAGAAVVVALASMALGAPAHAEGGDRTVGPSPLFVDDFGDLSAALFGPVDDPDFISRTTDFGLFTLTSAGDPDDDNYVAVVLQTAWFTNILTSGTDPEDNLGFGAASIGVAGETVNTFIVPGCPELDSTFSLPFTDPFAELFIDLIELGLI